MHTGGEYQVEVSMAAWLCHSKMVHALSMVEVKTGLVRQSSAA